MTAYKKMSDDLKDAEMWLDWAHHMKDDKDGMCLCETVADHLENWQEDLIRRTQKWS